MPCPSRFVAGINVASTGSLTEYFGFNSLFCSAADVIYDNVDEDANIIFGALVDDKITNGEVFFLFVLSFFVSDTGQIGSFNLSHLRR